MAVNEIIGTDGNEILTGTDENDKIYGGDGNDIILAGKGNDTITGGTGNNEIYFVKGDGDDVINLTKGEELVICLFETYNEETGSFTSADKDKVGYKYSANGKDLIIYYDKNDPSQGTITLKDYALKDVTDFVRLLFEDSDGNRTYVDLNKVTIETDKLNKNYTGTWMNDSINASEYQLYDKKGNEINDSSKKGLTLDGGKGNDTITGTKYSDVLKGGDGDDEIIGGAGNDTITGGKGYNKIVYKNGGGNDVINITKGEELSIVMFEEYDLETDNGTLADKDKFGYEYSANKKDLIIYYDKTDHTKGSITLKNYASNDVTDGIKIVCNNSEGSKINVILNKKTIETEAKKNFTGSWMKDDIDASEYQLYDKKGNEINDSSKKGLTLDGGKGNDTITGTKYSDVLKGGDGDDWLEGRKGNDTIYGDKGDDTIVGGEGNDKIYGGDGEDWIHGGAGNDTITGGKGNNEIYFVKGDGNDVINLTKGEELKIRMYKSFNFETGEFEFANKDQFGFEYSANKKDLKIYYDKEHHEYGSITLKNYATNDVTDGIKIVCNNSEGSKINVILNKKTIETEAKKNFTGSWMKDDIDAIEYQLYDKKGNEINDSSKKGLTLDGGKGNDTITGTKYSDVLKGGDGDDWLEGGKGNDTIYGGSGYNGLLGGDGNDVIYGGDGNDEIMGGEGNDTITGGKGYSGIYFVEGDGDDVVNLTKGEELCIGMFKAYNFETGEFEFANKDQFGFEYSANKKDLKIYYDKEHHEYGSITLKNYASKDVTDYIRIYGKNSEGQEDSFYLNEQIIETKTTKNFTGTWMNDEINASETTLYKDKKNTVEKEAKDKGLTIDGGKGNDKITGTRYSDVLKGGDGNDTITGGEGNDTITGGKGYNKIVYKNGGGNDVINITKGEDLAIALRDVADFDDITFKIASNKKDLLIYANKDNLDEFITIKNYVTKNVLNSGKFLLGEGEIEHSFDEMKFTVETTKNFTGTALNEIINASTATKGVTINAGAGNDEIIGSDFNDVLKGGKGSSDIQGGKGNDTIYGADGENTLNGGEGDDKIYGGAGNDTIYGGIGNDYIDGGKGNNSIEGGEGDDTIIGGDGNDTITGGAGNDVITGGKGENTIIHQTGDGKDTIILTKGEDLTIELKGPEAWSWINIAYDENGKDLLIYPNKNKDEYITIKNFITNDVTNSITLDINGEKYDLKTGKNLTSPISRPLYVENYTLKDTTGTWMADMLSGYKYQIKDETGSTVTDPTQKGLTLDGGAGDDIISGSKYSDTLIGGDGNDEINATQGGDDKIYGGNGNDTINCGSGNDYVEGGAGDDRIFGGQDNDTIYGNEGDDYIDGDEGNDSIYGGEGNDTIYGLAGDDYIEGGEGNDSIYGGDGSDTIYGLAGDDYIEGGKGDDIIKGGEGANHIVYNSGDGNDTIYLTKGEQFKLELKDVNSIDDVEFAVASNNRDYIIYVDKNNHSAGSITLDSFGITDVTNNATETTEDTSCVKLVINGTEYDLRKKDVTVTADYTGTWFNENIDASSATKGLNINAKGGNDTITGTAYNDTIYGGAGNDTIYGSDGDDYINCGYENDYIEGGKGNDSIYGGDGDDMLDGGDGDDYIDGGDGDDYINGGEGNDSLYGGNGNDIYEVYLAEGKYIEDESGDNDVLNFEEETDSSSNVTKDKLHIVFNVSKDFDKSTDTISMVNILDDTNFDSWKTNPTGDFEGVKIKDNAIENIYSSDNYNLTSADISALAESVASWLSDKGYADVNTVLAEGSDADVEALILKFNECNWQASI